jgi:hypothetical protein
VGENKWEVTGKKEWGLPNNFRFYGKTREMSFSSRREKLKFG